MARLLVSNGTLAKEAVDYKIAVGGVVKSITKACVAENGTVRQYWGGGAVPPPDVPPEILWTTDALLVTQVVQDPADSYAALTFTRSLGTYSYSNHPNANGSGQFLSPALDGTIADDSKYLLKVEQISGDPLTIPAGGGDIKDDLISFYKMEEDTTADRTDEINSYDLVPSATQARSAGKDGFCIEQRSPQTLSVAHAASPLLDFGDTDFCIDGWVRRQVGSHQNAGLISKWQGGQQAYLLNFENGVPDQLRWVVDSGAGFVHVQHGTVLTLNVWYYFYVYHDSVNNEIGISLNNGTPVTLAHSLGVANSTSPLLIGSGGYGGSLITSCDLDEIGFWNRLLTPAEIAARAAGLYYDSFGDGWVDLNESASYEVSLDKTSVGVSGAVANISIAEDDGGGLPVSGTTVTKEVTFASEVTDPTSIVWSTLQRDLVEIKIAEVATCDLILDPSGTSSGDADTSGSFTENWHEDAPSVTSPGNYTVRATLISGTAPTGSALGVDLTLNVLRQWTLTANANEDFTCELDIKVSDGTVSSTKRVTMHSSYLPETDENVWTDTRWMLGDAIPYAATGAKLVFGTDGVGEGFILLDGTPHESEDWHDDAPTPSDPGNYEVFVHQTGGFDVGSDTYTGTFETWLNLSTERTFQVNAANMGTLTQHYWEVSIRKVGQAAVTKEVRIFLGLDI